MLVEYFAARGVFITVETSHTQECKYQRGERAQAHDGAIAGIVAKELSRSALVSRHNAGTKSRPCNTKSNPDSHRQW